MICSTVSSLGLNMTTPIDGYELTDSFTDYGLVDAGPDPHPTRTVGGPGLRARIAPPYRQRPSTEQELPFRVKIVQSRADLERLCEHRASAYARHQPELVKRLHLDRPEPDDERPDVVILIAEHKTSGEVVGSMRLKTNLHTPLKFEEELDLPPYLQNQVLMEAGRLTASRGVEGHMVVPAMVKVSYEIAHQTGIDYSMLIGRPPIDKMYRAMQFSDVFEGKLVVTSAQPGVPVHLFCMPMEDAEQRWLDAQCPLYDFMATTEHKDLKVDPAVALRQFQRWD